MEARWIPDKINSHINIVLVPNEGADYVNMGFHITTGIKPLRVNINEMILHSSGDQQSLQVNIHPFYRTGDF